jgi:hypothetical protein
LILVLIKEKANVPCESQEMYTAVCPWVTMSGKYCSAECETAMEKALDIDCLFERTGYKTNTASSGSSPLEIPS